jgi:hypothetical protein
MEENFPYRQIVIGGTKNALIEGPPIGIMEPIGSHFSL